MPLTASASTRRQPTTARSAQAGRSDWLVENEYLGCHVRPEMASAETAITRRPVNRSTAPRKFCFHHLPEVRETR